MDESALLKSAKRMEPQALAAIFEIYAPAVFRYCFRLSQDTFEADSLVGDVFKSFLENLASGEGPVINLRSYIFQITFQTITDRLGTGRQPRLSEPGGTSPGQRHPITAWSKQQDEPGPQILTILKTELNAIQRHIILLRYLEQFSINETAFIVGKKPSNVKVIQTRAMAKLRQKLGTQRAPGSQSALSGADI